MKKLLFVALSAFALGAQAEDMHIYAGGGIGFWNVEQNGHDNTFNVGTVEGVIGLNVWKMINVEARAGLGFDSSTERTSEKYYENNVEKGRPADTQVKLDNFVSIYLRPEIKNDVAKLYGLVGYTSIEAESSNQYADRTLSLSGLSYGVGMGFQVNDATAVNIEYRKLAQQDDFTFSGFNIGFDIAF